MMKRSHRSTRSSRSVARQFFVCALVLCVFVLLSWLATQLADMSASYVHLVQKSTSDILSASDFDYVLQTERSVLVHHSAAISTDAPFDAVSSPAVVVAHYSESLWWLSHLGPNVSVHIYHKAHVVNNESSVDAADRKAPRSALSRALEATDDGHPEQILSLLSHAPEPMRLHSADIPLPAHPSRVTMHRLSNEDGWGRECSAYLAYIVSEYDRLPSRVAFVQGKPLFDSLSERGASDVAREFRSFQAKLHGRAGKSSARTPGFAYDDFVVAGSESFFFSRCFNDDYWDCCSLHNDTAAVLREVGIDVFALPQGEAVDASSQPHCAGRPFVTSATTAQFVVARRAIQRLTRRQWTRLLRFSVTPAWRTPRSPTRWWPQTNCHALEHVWHVLMGRQMNHYRCANITPTGTAWYAKCQIQHPPWRE
eukprot:TRINITY_DN45554_c0_g1_i1.p1 TRINITY_DN45554_c0_g1~~TRINITY_DN45554_c0_g1_i1.p1  ORF type:complete len:424 (+),score=36.38 TRINITY_DN45554_c0_g1_i1:112-1383(+)